MAKPRKWSNVAVAMQSAIAAAKPIIGITKASPAVANCVGHGLVQGSITILHDVVGMEQLNGMVVRVAAIADVDHFTLEGVDSTNFDDFVSGTSSKVTMGVSITTATSIDAAGGDFDFTDTTTIHAKRKSQIPGLPNASTFTFTNIWDVSDLGLKAMKVASDAQELRVFSFTFGTGGQKMYFAGYVGASLLPGGQAQGLVTTPSTITMDTDPTYYAS